jgi:hypothetical protein
MKVAAKAGEKNSALSGGVFFRYEHPFTFRAKLITSVHNAAEKEPLIVFKTRTVEIASTIDR